MMAFLKVMKEQFGDAETYVIERCGLTKDEVEKIRGNLIVEEAAVHDKVQHSL